MGGTFVMSFYLNTLPTIGNGDYFGYYSKTLYTGVTDTGTVDEDAWPECVFWGYNPGGGTLVMDCVVGIGQPNSTYTGRMFSQPFTCTADGTLTLKHGENDTYLAADGAYVNEGEGTSETLNIDCVEPQAYPGDTDGDGCPDTREQTMNPMMGGDRNFLNPWDFFDPNNDGIHRIPDITMVNMLYGMDEGVSPYYTQEVDRTLLGPNDWNLGPPNGTIRFTDVVAAVRSYGHDCP
jgi:hypothetical protein